MAKNNCEFFEHCTNSLKPGNTTGVCSPCYSALYYWQNKSIARKMRRMRALEKFHARMEFVTGVTSVTAKRRRKYRRAA